MNIITFNGDICNPEIELIIKTTKTFAPAVYKFSLHHIDILVMINER